MKSMCTVSVPATRKRLATPATQTLTARSQSFSLPTLKRSNTMKTLNTLTAAALIAASSSALAVATPDRMVISASSYLELATIAGLISPDQTQVAETPSSAKFTPQPLSVQRSMYMPQPIEVVDDTHSDPRGQL
jgi:hypothetical protein